MINQVGIEISFRYVVARYHRLRIQSGWTDVTRMGHGNGTGLDPRFEPWKTSNSLVGSRRENHRDF